ncbi:hypothetical protein [Edaphobacter sp.]|uniref:hypothetical protein n=1 Tax=Edaphobacter sp. TaxID=1934404 RepID=UPI002DBA0E3B|nr:hypothetical protein [Edaphobacter sp.]HEU5340698.1 hypothetical protein [Edaphobacter sp.]
MFKPTGKGRYFIKIDPLTKVVRLWLYNYDIEGAHLKKDHVDVIDASVTPLLRDGGNIKLLGLASTTGNASFDATLSQHRMDGVVSHLRVAAGGRFAVSKEFAFGKQMALAFGAAKLKGGTADNTESEIWRAVVINAWNRDTVPPPPPGVDIPISNNTWSDDVSKTLDKVSFALGLIDFAADLAEIEAVTAVTGPAGLILSCIQSIVAMPLMWFAGDATANVNGQIQGAADAIQDMADQFSNPVLDHTPLSKWPAVKVPATHHSENPTPTVSEQAWRAGQVKGLLAATQKVVDLELHPKPVTLPDGKHIRLSGRLWLRALSKTYKDNAGIEIVIKPANEELRKQGKRPFPTI